MSAIDSRPPHAAPPAPVGHLDLARWHLGQGELDAAAAACREGLAENPPWVELAQIYLTVLEQLRDGDAATELYGRVIVHHPFSAPLRRAYAAVLAACGQAQRAENLRAEATDLDPDADVAAQEATEIPAPRDLSEIATPPDDDAISAPVVAPTEESNVSSKADDEPVATFDDVTLGASTRRDKQRDIDDENVAALRPSRPLIPILATLAAVGAAGLALALFWPSPPPDDRRQPPPTASATPSATIAMTASRPATAAAATRPATTTSRPTATAATSRPTPNTTSASRPTPNTTSASRPTTSASATPRATKAPLTATSPRVAAAKTSPSPSQKITPSRQEAPPPAALTRRYAKSDPRHLLQRAIAAVAKRRLRRGVRLGHRALRRLRRRRALGADHLALLIHLGTALGHTKRWTRDYAHDLLFEAARRPNAPTQAFVSLGRVYVARHDSARAVWCFRQARKRSPRDAIIYLELGKALWKKRRWRPMARRALRRFIALAPDHPKVAWARRRLR